MKALVGRLSLIVLLGAVVLAGCRDKSDTQGLSEPGTPSSSSNSKEISEVTDNRPAVATVQEGSLVYLSGEVEWSSEDSPAWLPAEIGQIVHTGDSIRTFDDAWCELQFSGRSVVRVQENTLFTIDRIYSNEQDASALKGRLGKGAIAAKVKKLAGNESLEITAPTVACAVRGTVFMMSVDDTETTIAVGEGSVAIIPEGLNLDDRKANPVGKSAELISKFEASLPLVQAGDEIVLGAREQNDLIAEVQQISQILDSAEPDDALLNTAAEGLAKVIGESSKLSDKSKDILEPMEREGLVEGLDQPRETLVNLTWRVVPGDAELIVNETIRGSGRVSGTWLEGEKLKVTARRPGYREYQAEYSADFANDKTIVNLSLEKLPTRYFDLYAKPEDSRIIVDGVDKGAVYRAAISWEETTHIRIVHDDYNEQRLQLDYSEAPQGRVDLELQPTLKSVLPTISAKIVGLEKYAGRLIPAYDDGTVLAIGPDGSRQWKYTSTNSPNENSRPQSIGTSVFFSGIDEFVILDTESGSRIYSATQTPKTTHMLGRRAIPFGSLAVYPETEALVLINPKDGKEVRRIELDAPSQMTPLVVGENLYTVSTDGTFRGFNSAGQEIVRIPTTANKPIGHAPAVAGGIVFFGDRSGFIHAINLATKQYLWKQQTGKAIQDDLAISGSTLVVYSNHDVYLLNARTGSFNLPPIRGFSSIPFVSEGFLYGGLETGELVAFNIQTGEEDARVAINGQISSNGVLLDDTVAFGTDGGEIYIMNRQHPSLLGIPGTSESAK